MTQTDAVFAFASLLAVSVAQNPDRTGRERAARRLSKIILTLADEFAEAKRTGSLQRPNR
jgi:hypothetical protein